MIVFIIIGIVIFLIILFVPLLLFLMLSSGSNEEPLLIPNEEVGKEVNILDGYNHTLTFNEVENILSEKLGNAGFMTLDSSYKILNLNTLKSFLNSDNTDFYTYKAEGFDCDDFARVLQGDVLKAHYNAMASLSAMGNQDLYESGIAFGTVYGDISLNGEPPQPHAMNLAIVDNNRLVLIEPQTDIIYEPNNYSNYWLVVI